MLGMGVQGMPAMDSIARPSILPPFPSQVPPTDEVNRMVIKDTSLSLKVKDVAHTVSEVERISVSLGGHLVNSHVSVPEGASTGTISVRVPSERRADALTQFKGLAVKVVSESVSGTDVTDQYVDYEERLRVLESTKAKFEAILEEARTVSEMLNVQRELLNLQSQIDQIKGQQQYLSQSAKLSHITLYVSTDELALPFSPDQPWRPAVVFKTAVRSLVMHLRGLASLLIWAVVYSPVWLTGLVLLYILRKKPWVKS